MANQLVEAQNVQAGVDSSNGRVVIVAPCFMVCLLITRMVAETGMPFIRIDGAYPHHLIGMFPLSWMSPATMYFSAVMSILFQIGSRVIATTMAAHTLGLADELSPRRQARLAWGLGGVLMLGLVVWGGR